MGSIPHKAGRLLDYLRRTGAPVHLKDPPWDHSRLERAARRGAHQSAVAHRDFLYDEMSDMVEKGQWLVLPYKAARHLPHLRLSPVGVVPQHNRRPRTIVDYSFHNVNRETVPLMAPEAM